MDDSKGARLFFALAAALVPVQFSQLAGMIHELYGNGATLLPSVLSFEGVSAFLVAAVAAVTFLVAVPVAFAGFSVLAREHAARLTSTFLGINSLILLPPRASLIGLGILAVLAVLAVVLERRYFARSPAFETLEGLGVRAMFVLPLAIAAGRLGFHIDTLSGLCAMGGVVSLLVTRAASIWRQRPSVGPRTDANGWHDFSLVVGLLIGASSWMVFATNTLNPGSAGYHIYVVMLPIAALVLQVGRLVTSGGRAFRAIASALVAGASSLALLIEPGYGPKLATLAIGVALGGWGIYRREREPTVVGGALTMIGVATLAKLAIENVSVSAWVVLAALGVVLVLASSALERYGRRLLGKVGDAWEDLTQWQ